MLFKSTALAVLAVASQVVAEPMPYKAAAVHKMSVRAMFGIVGRSEDGYSPSTSLCGLGTTCAEACGAGFATCASDDAAIHCYNAGAAQTCCPDGSGNSCDAGYYCTGSTAGETVCCPEGQTLAECAANYNVTGSLTSEVASSSTAAPSSSTTVASSSAILSSSSSSSSWSSSSSSSSSSWSSAAPNTTTAAPTTHATHKANSTVITSWGTSFATAPCASGVSTSAAATGAANNFTTTGSPSATSTDTVATSAGDFLKPAGAAAALLAAAFTLLL